MSKSLRNRSPKKSRINNDKVNQPFVVHSNQVSRNRNLVKMRDIAQRHNNRAIATLGGDIHLDWSPEYCASIISRFQDEGEYHPGTVMAGGGDSETGLPYRKDTTIRSVGTWILDLPEINDQLVAIFHNLNEMIWGYDLFDIEAPQLCVYYATDQGHYSWHPDTSYGLASEDGDDNMYRKLSISILLNDSREFEGGEMQILSGVTVEGSPKIHTAELNQPGDAIIFESRAYHRVKTVTKGTRAALVTWCWGKR